jgi:hypothetical protein
MLEVKMLQMLILISNKGPSVSARHLSKGENQCLIINII